MNRNVKMALVAAVSTMLVACNNQPAPQQPVRVQQQPDNTAAAVAAGVAAGAILANAGNDYDRERYERERYERERLQRENDRLRYSQPSQTVVYRPSPRPQLSKVYVASKPVTYSASKTYKSPSSSYTTSSKSYKSSYTPSSSSKSSFSSPSTSSSFRSSPSYSSSRSYTSSSTRR